MIIAYVNLRLLKDKRIAMLSTLPNIDSAAKVRPLKNCIATLGLQGDFFNIEVSMRESQ